MKKFLSNWQGLWALITVSALYWITPKVFSLFDLNAGVIDPAYVHALIFTAGVFFLAIFCAWLALQFDWKVLDRYLDDGKLVEDWRHLTPQQRVAWAFGSVAFLIAAFLACFFALPKP